MCGIGKGGREGEGEGSRLVTTSNMERSEHRRKEKKKISGRPFFSFFCSIRAFTGGGVVVWLILSRLSESHKSSGITQTGLYWE